MDIENEAWQHATRAQAEAREEERLDALARSKGIVSGAGYGIATPRELLAAVRIQCYQLVSAGPVFTTVLPTVISDLPSNYRR